MRTTSTLSSTGRSIALAEYAKHAHMMADGYYPTGKGKFFRASNSGFLTAENNHIIVRLPSN